VTDNALKIKPARIYVDVTVDGNIMLIAVDDDLGDSALWLTPESAAKLGQILIDVASKVKRP
jgi:hypothetical protein